GLSELADTAPLWQVSIVPEQFREAGFPTSKPSALPEAAADSALHLCMHYPLEIPVGESRSIQFGACVGLNRDRAMHFVQNDLQQDVSAASRRAWQTYYSSVPYFSCSDAYLERIYWYRWYGLRLLTVNLKDEDAPKFPN